MPTDSSPLGVPALGDIFEAFAAQVDALQQVNAPVAAFIVLRVEDQLQGYVLDNVDHNDQVFSGIASLVQHYLASEAGDTDDEVDAARSLVLSALMGKWSPPPTD